MITLYTISEQILRILNGGFPSIRSRVIIPEIKLHVAQVANALLKAEYLNITMTLEGGSIPDGALIATYEGISCTRVGTNTKVALPASPMMLPEKIGVWAVYPSGRPDLAFIPVPIDTIYQLNDTQLFSPLNTILYTFDNKNITIYADLVGMNIPTVDLRLCVSDISNMSEHDPLPISAELQSVIVTKVCEILASRVDSTREDSITPEPSNKQ